MGLVAQTYHNMLTSTNTHYSQTKNNFHWFNIQTSRACECTAVRWFAGVGWRCGLDMFGGRFAVSAAPVVHAVVKVRMRRARLAYQRLFISRFSRWSISREALYVMLLGRRVGRARASSRVRDLLGTHFGRVCLGPCGPSGPFGSCFF